MTGEKQTGAFHTLYMLLGVMTIALPFLFIMDWMFFSMGGGNRENVPKFLSELAVWCFLGFPFWIITMLAWMRAIEKTKDYQKLRYVMALFIIGNSFIACCFWLTLELK